MSLYYLICCYPDEYNRIVQNILSTQSDQQIVQRLADAFTKLTKNINCQRLLLHRDKKIFRNSFDEFICNVQGFLMIK